MANAIIGSAKILRLRRRSAFRSAFWLVFTWPNTAGERLHFSFDTSPICLMAFLRLSLEFLRMGIVVKPMEHFSTFAGGVRAGHHDDSHCGPDHGTILAICPQLITRRLNGAWCEQGNSHFYRACSGRATRADFGYDAESGGCGRGNGAFAFYGVGEYVWSQGWSQPSSSLPVMIYHYAISPVRRLPSASVGSGFRTARSSAFHQRHRAPYYLARSGFRQEITLGYSAITRNRNVHAAAKL